MYEEFDGVHKSTFMVGMIVINQPDIVPKMIGSYRQHRISSNTGFKERMFNRNMEQYDKYCDDYEQNEDIEI